MISFPLEVYGVVVCNVRDGEWLDYGTLRATPEASRSAFVDFQSKASAQWREDNKPVKIRKMRLEAP